MAGRIRSLAAITALVTTIIAPAAARAAGPVPVGTIGLDQAVFWDGGRVDWSPLYSLPSSPTNENLDRCATAGPCYEYALVVADEGAATLRIALDTPMRDDGFEWAVYDPAGTRKTRVTNSNHFTREALIAAPVAGTWTIKVAPFSADDAPFRMRAKLESAPFQPIPDAEGRLLPNLKVFRIWEFTFAAPLNPANGTFPPDDQNPPADVSGIHPVSCAADEIAEGGAQRCLRYSFGLANTGQGNFDVRYTSTTDPTAKAPMTQCVQRADGAPEAHPAGIGGFHATHGHWHYEDIISHRLLRVTDPVAGTMEPTGAGKKLGYSPADQGMPEWSLFDQAPPGSSGAAGNCAPGTGNRLGMSRGWGDAYRYQRPGNYVEFGDNTSGYYVVQTTADPLNNVIESDESDNTAYAYISVAIDALGTESIDIIETGIGQSPWDPAKVRIDPWYEHPETVPNWPAEA